MTVQHNIIFHTSCTHTHTHFNFHLEKVFPCLPRVTFREGECVYVKPTPLMCPQKGLRYRGDHRDWEEVAQKWAATKKCHSEWKLLNMPFGKPFLFFPEATAGNMLSAYFTFGFQGHVPPEAMAWERALKLIRVRFPCPGFHDGYFSPLPDRCTMTSLFTPKMSNAEWQFGNLHYLICMKLHGFFLSGMVCIVLPLHLSRAISVFIPHDIFFFKGEQLTT